MKAISLWQPWASLFVLPDVKRHETRHWYTPYRGPLAIHAAKTTEGYDVEPRLAALLRDRFGKDWALALPRGALLGVVDLVACYPTLSLDLTETERICGNFTPGRWAWRKERARAFAAPIPYKGMQGFFEVPDDIIARALGTEPTPAAQRSLL
jgi:hypothetical protein